MKKTERILKIKILLVVCVIFVNLLAGQPSKNFIIYSELTSHLRGNSSQNLSFEYSSEKIMHSIGLDFIYNIRNSERELQSSKISYGINYKFGFDLLNQSPDNMFIGLNLKYNRLHMYQLDSEFDKPWTEKNNIYDKNYHKITPLVILQFNRLFNKRLYLGTQFGLGIPYIYKVNSSLSRGFKDYKEIEGLVDLSAFFEHGIHRNETGPLNAFAMTFNLLIGIKI